MCLRCCAVRVALGESPEGSGLGREASRLIDCWNDGGRFEVEVAVAVAVVVACEDSRLILLAKTSRVESRSAMAP